MSAATLTYRPTVRPPWAQTAGFTLVELLVAITLVGMLVVVLYGALSIGVRSWDSGESQVIELNELRTAQEFLRRQLRRSRTVYASNEEGRRTVAFRSDGETLLWVAPMLEHLGLGGLYILELSSARGDGGDVLRLRFYPYRFRDDEIDRDAADEVMLLAGISDLRWSFYGTDGGALEEPDWYDEWDNERFRPDLVKIELNWNGQPWPPLVVPLFN